MQGGRIGGRSCGLYVPFSWWISPPWYCLPTHTSFNVNCQAFDAMIHFGYEGSFLYLSVFGRQVNNSTGPFAALCALTIGFFTIADVPHPSSP
jgi:hypothetical protein